jgi:RNase P/RNase MRP subunit POP5
MGRPDGKERKRYIGFRVEPEEGPAPGRHEMVAALDAACRSAGLPDRRRLTVFTGVQGIARCTDGEQATMVKILSSIGEVGGRPVLVTTLVTSGTIKKVKGHLGLDRDS